MHIHPFTRCQWLPLTCEQVVGPAAFGMCMYAKNQMTGRYISTPPEVGDEESLKNVESMFGQKSLIHTPTTDED